MAIAWDSTGNSGVVTAAVISYSHTVTVSTGKFLLVRCVSGWDGVNEAINSVTFGGLSCTKLLSYTQTISGKTLRIEWWYQCPTLIGTNTVVVTKSGAVGNMHVHSLCFKGVDVRNPIIQTAANFGADITPTVIVSGVTDGLVLDDAIAYRAAGFPTATIGAGQTGFVNTAMGGVVRRVSSSESGAGNRTMDWTLNVAADKWLSVGIGLRPSPASGSVAIGRRR